MCLKSARSVVVWAIMLVFSIGTAGANPELDYQQARKLHETGNYVESADRLRSAVAQGHLAALLPLAAMYRAGQGVKQDFGQSLRLFTLAAEKGYPSAQFTLGVMYRAGEGTPQDYSVAIKWFLKAAHQGHQKSQNNLGTMFERGRGVKSDYLIALMWYEIAAMNGNIMGARNQKRLARKLSPPDVLRVQKTARSCMKSNYKTCSLILTAP